MSVYQARLNELLADCSVNREPLSVIVSGITVDSRVVAAGDLFVALKGAQYDARTDALAALKSGAVAVLIDSADRDTADKVLLDMPDVFEVEDLSLKLSEIAGRFYQHPSNRVTLVGITGTNGKTTISFYLAQMLEKLGHASAVMGTLGVGPIGHIHSTGMTTPDAITTQRHLAELCDAGIETVCMEVSSHALALGRVAALSFDYLVFSNISQDHLDFHRSMESYAQTKASLFKDYDFKVAIINADDALGRELLDSCEGRAISYGLNNAQLSASDITLESSGINFKLQYKAEKIHLSSNLIGEFNVLNTLAVLGCGLAMGNDLAQMKQALAACQAVPGRMERIKAGSAQPVVVVDYAHTPDALDKALSACRSHCEGVLSVVFGCGGDRDKAKRPQMGAIAEARADHVFITDDNPRSESPAAIAEDIVAGMIKPANIIYDRAKAIEVAIRAAAQRDWVLIAGKGHESTQTYADRVVTVNDRELAQRALRRLAA